MEEPKYQENVKINHLNPNVLNENREKRVSSTSQKNMQDQAFFNLITLLIRFISFQFNLVISLVKFPIWLSYFSFTILIFPLENLRYLTAKLANALFWSSYVFVMLLGLLSLGFVLGGLIMRNIIEKPIQVTQLINFDYTKANPVAFVPILPYETVGGRVIPHNTKLHLFVSLMLPESDYNHRLGIFQVRVELLSRSGNVTSSWSHPCMLRFKSQPIRMVETMILSVPVIAGFKSESQILTLKKKELVEGLEATAFLKVVLESRAEFEAGVGIPQIYESSFSLQSELPKFKRVVWNWKATIFVWISVALFFVELFLVLMFCRPLFIPKPRSPLYLLSVKKDVRL